MPQVRIIAKNFMDMVAALPAMKLDKLYDSSLICEAVLRSLPPLAKKYVLQMLFIDLPVSARTMEEWVLPDGSSKHKVAIDRLLQLRIFLEVIDRKRESSYRLNPIFQENLRKYLIHGGTLPREPMPSNVTVRLPTLEDLDAYAIEQWECFLLQLINSGQVERLTGFNPSMIKVFQRGLLSTRDNEPPKLTENGFQFLLMDTNAQLWYIIREYISSSEGHGVDPAELISFLLELSFHAPGKAYNMNTLADVQKFAISDLAALGLVKLQQGRKDNWFIPTKLATNLSMSLSDSSSRKENVEGPSRWKRSLMDLWSSKPTSGCMLTQPPSYTVRSYVFFARVEYQLPNLIVGAITKESLYNAFENGITGEQIIAFLQQNAHPRVAEKTPSVPENVTDQIRLWETDRNRVEMVASNLYDDFPSKEVFEAACDFGREIGGLLWEDSKKMCLIVRGESHQEMRDFLRRQK